MKLRKSYYALAIIVGGALALDTFVRTLSPVTALAVFVITILFGIGGMWFGWKIREKVAGLRRNER